MIETFTNRKMNMYPELDTGTQYRLNEINRIKYYFAAERETISKAHSKYIAAFSFFYKILLVLSVTSAIFSISLLGTAVGPPC